MIPRARKSARDSQDFERMFRAGGLTDRQRERTTSEESRQRGTWRIVALWATTWV